MRKLLAVVLVAAFAGSMPLAAAAPSNDDFADATAITAIPFSETLSNADATNEPLEPMACGPTTRTVWYTLTAAEGGTYVLDTRGSDFDTVLAAYVGDGLADLESVGCDDDSYGAGGPSRVVVWAEAGQTLHVQAGGWAAETGSLTINVAVPGGIRGTVTDLDGEPLDDICVSMEPSDEFGFPYFNGTITGEDGTYEITEVLPGDYKVGFWPCGESWYASEFYDDKPDWESADDVTVASGTVALGIDAALKPIQAPDPVDATDLAVTDLRVENVPLQTDGGSQGYTGWVRRVNVSVANLSDVTPDRYAYVFVTACPVTAGRCTSIGRAPFEAQAGSTTDLTFKWNGLGAVGDYVVTADVCVAHDESNYRNNYRSIDHYVIAGGTGFGVGVLGTPPPLYFAECYPGVVIAETARA